MKTYTEGMNTLCISDQRLREDLALASLAVMPQGRFIGYTIESAYRRLMIPKKAEFFDVAEKISGKRINSVSILDAHGEGLFGRWVYNDDSIFPRRVQRWIDENDGRYDLLLLHVCNPLGITPSLKKSLAVIPNDVLSIMHNIAGAAHTFLIPGKNSIKFNYREMNIFKQ